MGLWLPALLYCQGQALIHVCKVILQGYGSGILVLHASISKLPGQSCWLPGP